ncbi:YcnI family copper-binding membrane protein [Terrabacter sp. 2RAF25]|uniref:YcnI family copper-binding membrane protein n=1 Tax=Terrabacter sp. 2RAF25 TaxID=3232998 RepID=UPI003F9C0136
MFQKSRVTLRRNVTRIGAGAGIALAATFALPGIASAHVSIEPGTVEGGEGAVIAVRVPNERDDASTTRLRLVLPADNPIGSVRTTEMPGWKATTATRKLATPIDVFGRKVDTVVSQVTWTSTDGVGIRPGQYKDFNLSLGPLPESGELIFSAVQTYSGGETVNWNEVSADKTTEPEHPAPVLQLTRGASAAATPDASGAATGSGSGATSDTTAVAAVGSAATSADSGSGTASLALSGAALLVSLLAAVLAWRRGRSAAPVTATPAAAAPVAGGAPGTSPERAPEDARP